MNNSMVETAVGAIVIAIAAGFFMFMYTVGGVGGPASGYQVSASFGSVKGVSVGTDVRMAGIKIGSVTGQTLDRDTYRATIVMDVDTTVKLPEDSTAKIASESLLGGNFVQLDPGGSDTFIEPGGEILFTQDPIDIFGLVSQFVLGSNKSDDKKAENAGSDASAQEEQPAQEQQPAQEEQRRKNSRCRKNSPRRKSSQCRKSSLPAKAPRTSDHGARHCTAGQTELVC
jgi:phospholipid/cholesterol/gamma-HCH transport system substrate-binding protein